MPHLPEALHEAVGQISPSFDEGDITRRAAGRRARRRVLAVGAAGALVLCAAIVWLSVGRSDRTEVRTASPSSTTRPTAIPAATLAELRAALATWATFPVAARPRPLILLSESPYGGPPITFNNDTKDAFDSGAFNQPRSFPDAPAVAGGYPIITAAAALDALRAEASPVSGPHPTPVPLTITDIRLDHASFQTDRGLTDLPAWMFTFQGVQGTAAVPAVAPAARYPLPVSAQHTQPLTANVGADDKTLTVTFTGAAAGTGPCTADYTIDSDTSATAVAIAIQEHRHGTGTEVFCTTVGYSRTAAVTLDEPLAARVLVTTGANAPVAIQRPGR